MRQEVSNRVHNYTRSRSTHWSERLPNNFLTRATLAFSMLLTCHKIWRKVGQSGDVGVIFTMSAPFISLSLFILSLCSSTAQLISGPFLVPSSHTHYVFQCLSR